MAGDESIEEETVEEIEVDEYVLTDSDGNDVRFGVLLEFEMDGVTYLAMSPIDQLEDDENDAPDVFLFVYEVHEEDGETFESFGPIEDEAIFKKASEFASQQIELLAGS